MHKINWILSFIKHIPWNIFLFFRDSVFNTISFLFLLITYLSTSLITGIFLSKYMPLPWKIKNTIVQAINSIYQRIVKLNHLNEDSINRTNLIQLALYNMRFKKSRTFITVGGMAIGIAVIVYLVSIGYGVQELVISRVARLEEMRQTNISPPVGGRAKINDQTISQMQEIIDVEKVLPQIAAVGRVSYNNSVSDVVVYGVTSDYLHHSAIKPSSGKIFESNDLILSSNISSEPQIAGISIEPETATLFPAFPSSPIDFNSKINDVDFSLNPGEWVRVRDKPTRSGQIIGYTRRTVDFQRGETVWGGVYVDNDQTVGEGEDGTLYNQWVKANFPLWQAKDCDVKNAYCADGKYVLQKDEQNYQISQSGYIAALAMQIQPIQITPVAQVLGEQTSISEVISAPEVLQATEESASETESAPDDEFIELNDETTAKKADNVIKVDLTDKAVKQVVVNKATLQLLGIEESTALDSKFNLSFIVTGDLLENADQKLESNPTEYQIVGVVPDDRTPVMYVPFIDVRSVGVVNYSQTKVLAKNQDNLPKIRTQIEALGFSTQSVSDTVAQINSLFATARTILFLVGMAALAVASLGMFNTLTVSLLERTREVGLMKAMGMRSSEVHELFPTESMIMGLFGGLMGLIMGVVAGQATSIALSIYAVKSGVGYISISYTPPVFIAVILTLAMCVGLITGMYPARHATRISALNALRYE